MRKIGWVGYAAAWTLLAACGGDSTTGGGAGAGGGAVNVGSSGAAGTVMGGGGSGGSGGGSAGRGGGSGGSGGPSSSAGAGGSAGGASEDTLASACLEYIRVQCKRMGLCYSGTVDPEASQACFEISARDCPDIFFAEGSSRTLENTLACTAEWAAFPCDAFRRQERPACATAGTREAGASCAFSSQCASARCSSGGGTTCGTCLPLVAAGEACVPGSSACERGYTCSEESRTCVAFTVPEPTPPTYPGLGEPCDPLIGCGGAATADCERDPSTGESRCVPWPTLGQDCSPLSVRTCLLGDSYCDISGTCLALPEDGEPCGVDAWTGRASWCADDHSCDSEATPPTCRAPVTGGQPCEAPFPGCASGLNCECDDAACATRHCKRLRWPGESCSAADDLCLPGATRCEAGVCVGLNEVQGLFESRCMP